MSRILAIVFVVALATACQSQSDPRSPAREPKPNAVRKLADAYIAALPRDQKPTDLDSVRDDFIRYFFMGFTNPTGSMSGGAGVVGAGFKAGQQFRRENPEKTKEMFESFGYVFTEAVGVWTVGFEHSGFKPRGIRQNEQWWLSGMGDTVSELPKDKRIPDEGIRIRISGFLSPQGSYGYLGGYDHEFYATRISRADGG